jgi:hypothetical protein
LLILPFPATGPEAAGPATSRKKQQDLIAFMKSLNSK